LVSIEALVVQNQGPKTTKQVHVCITGAFIQTERWIFWSVEQNFLKKDDESGSHNLVRLDEPSRADPSRAKPSRVWGAELRTGWSYIP